MGHRAAFGNVALMSDAEPDNLPAAAPSSEVRMRASDADREYMVELLRTAFADGYLTVDEFSDRAAQVYAARFADELPALAADFPGPAAVTTSSELQPAKPRRRGGRRWTILASSVRSGRWIAGTGLRQGAFLGNIELDLRQAVLASTVTELDVRAVLGAVQVLVPHGVHVEVDDTSILGSCDVKVDAAQALRGAPVVRIRAKAVLGSVDIRYS